MKLPFKVPPNAAYNTYLSTYRCCLLYPRYKYLNFPWQQVTMSTEGYMGLYKLPVHQTTYICLEVDVLHRSDLIQYVTFDTI